MGKNEVSTGHQLMLKKKKLFFKSPLPRKIFCNRRVSFLVSVTNKIFVFNYFRQFLHCRVKKKKKCKFNEIQSVVIIES